MVPVELSHRLGISPGSTTELVDRLERAGTSNADATPMTADACRASASHVGRAHPDGAAASIRVTGRPRRDVHPRRTGSHPAIPASATSKLTEYAEATVDTSAED